MAITKDQRRRALRIALKALALLIGLPLFYIICGIAGSVVPANADWREPREGVRIFVRTNGVHTWLLVPKVNRDADWRGIADPADIRDRRYGASNYLAFGFGNRDFYLNTRTWGDLTLKTALAAAFGRGPGLMHVEHAHDPKPDEYQSPLMVSRAEYRILAAHIRQSFLFDADGEPVLLPGRGYGPDDAFYLARGDYNMARTCNEWTGEGLREAGVRTGLWTPFAQGVMWRLGR
jgi:uncharacterized protein (TIGR02117 family)